MAEQKARMLESCTSCGICVKECPVYTNTSLASAHPVKLQRKVLGFLRGGEPDEDVFKRAFYCMLCYKCADLCPKGLNSLLLIYLLRQEYRERGLHAVSYPSPRDPHSPQRVLAAIQTSAEEHRLIFTRSAHRSAQYVFFPGCGAYAQPDSLLSALDIVAATGVDCAFLPGIENCCGINCLTGGEFAKVHGEATALIDRLSEFQPQSVVFGCATCLSVFKVVYASVFDMPFEAISLAQFLTQNLDKLQFGSGMEGRVTLHEACKAAHIGADVVSAREILRRIPGVELVEMERSGKNAGCCGGLSLAAYPHEIEGLRDSRLREAKSTGAGIVVDVCHACHSRLVGEAPKYGFEVVNYVSVIARGLGIERADKYKTYMLLGRTGAILEETKSSVGTSMYPTNVIVDTISNTFAKGDRNCH